LAKQTHQPKGLASLVVFFLSSKSCCVLVYSALLNLWFLGNLIWPGSIPEGWELEWEQVDDE
jgi:hypothetical protein